MVFIHDYSSQLNRINTIMYELQRSNNKADETRLWQAIANPQSAIDQKTILVVDARMQAVEAEFSRIALQTNPNLASDQEKYKSEIAAKAAADTAKAAAANAKTLKIY